MRRKKADGWSQGDRIHDSIIGTKNKVGSRESASKRKKLNGVPRYPPISVAVHATIYSVSDKGMYLPR